MMRVSTARKGRVVAESVAVCLVCGEPLAYFEEAQEVFCQICGKRETGHSVCVAGHYVCDACHRAGGVACVREYCLNTTSRNPVAIAQEIMAQDALYPNGPEHHVLAGSALLAAYGNAGGEIDLAAGLAELVRRGEQVPGGACGYWGVCGATISAGQFWSVVSGSTPMTRTPWAQCQALTARIGAALADIGGPRCCKRTTFTAIVQTAAFVRETCGVAMDVPEKIVCAFSERNKQCLRGKCPYFPRDERACVRAAVQ